MTEGELGKKVHLDSGTLAPLLKRLEKQGLVERSRPHTNQRKLLVSLTEKGDALKDAAADVPFAVRSCIDLPDEELIMLKSLLNKALMGMKEKD